MLSITNIETKDTKCKFLEIMLYVSFVLLIGLNIYIAFEIVQSVKANDWTTKLNMASQLYFTKENKILRVGIVKDDNKTSINYMATY